ncbi:DUF3617 family protein [Caulobacter sp. 17J65-9]|uniref:DUF3617 domain-containing protein n=1 Tax=Caulobacter sp. 17J65-9 TaxID=2709382 RepID=UPI0013C9B7A3|nr:DUF3617 family protein [Caulobacter sp. 17J65-9]NEX94964.1 DUF3617 family protein [Caulobacter sp. 17J65-9]
MRRKAFLIVPLLALAACSGPKDEARPDAASKPVQAGGPSLDGPMLATPGLWRTKTMVNGRPALGANKTCVDAASQKAEDMFTQQGATGCQSPARRQISGGYAYDLVCEQDGLKTLVSGEVKGDAKHVVMTSTTRMTGPDGDVMPPATVVIDSAYVGPCPAGMKPGDSVQEAAR